MMKRFCTYIGKVFDFSRQIHTLEDARKRPRIPTLAIWGSAFFLFVMRHRSLHGMEQDLRQPKRVERVMGKIKPSADRKPLFYNLCLQHGKHVISVLKGEQRLLLQDAQGVFSLMEPTVWKEQKAQTRVEIRAWDAEGFITAEGIKVPLRVLHTEETLTQRHRKSRQWVEETEIHSWWWATTLSMSQMSTRWFWHIAHRRWEIENHLLHTLATYWALDHCFKHHPTGILNFVLTLFIAFVLLQSFYSRNLNPQRRIRLTWIGLTKELHLGLIPMDIPAAWVYWQGG